MGLNTMFSTTIVIVIGAVLQSAMGQTCADDGCINGDCLVGPPIVCRCRPGFVKSDNPNVCIDINECAQTLNPCVSTSTYYQYGYYFPQVQNQCINTQGGYQCQCYPPSYVYGNPQRCYTTQFYQPRSNFYQSLLTYSLFDGDFGDFFDFKK